MSHFPQWPSVMVTSNCCLVSWWPHMRMQQLLWPDMGWCNSGVWPCDHSLCPELPLVTGAAISTGHCYHCQLCLPFPNAINLNDTQIDSISIFKHRLKYFKAANQIDDASDKLAADLIERLCLCVARLLRTGHAFRESKPLTGGCELCVINCKYFCPNN